MIKSNKPKRRGQGKKPQPQIMKSLRPNQFVAQSIRTFGIRTIAQNGVTGANLTATALANLLGVVATSTTTANFITALFRLKKITMWGPVATPGESVTVSLQWTNASGDFMTPPVTYMDSSVSFDYPAFLCKKPPVGSISSKWHKADNTESLLTITFPTGATVDFEFDWQLNDNAVFYAPVASGVTFSGLVVGTFYHHPVASGDLIPQNVNEA
jgi:hypothetical protein